MRKSLGQLSDVREVGAMLRVFILAIVVAAAGMISTPRSANAAGWCAVYSYGGTNCGFNTYRQCQRAVSGVGGYCRRSY